MKDHPDYSGKTYKRIVMLYKKTIYDFSTSLSATTLSLTTFNGLNGIASEKLINF